MRNPLPRIAEFFGRPSILQDLHVYGGLAVAGVGGWMLSPAWTLIAIGLALIGIALLLPLFGRKTG